MKFCSECNNMYYIKIDYSKASQLLYYCRNCGHEDNNIENGGVCVINTQYTIHIILNTLSINTPNLIRLFREFTTYRAQIYLAVQILL